jgi:predicted ester cyclase
MKREMTTEEKNKELIEQMYRDSNSLGVLANAHYFAEQVSNHGMPATRTDIENVMSDIDATFSHVLFVPLTLVAEDDWVTVRCLFKGVHTGIGRHPYLHEGLLTGVAPTHRSISVQHIHMFRIEDGQIVEHHASRDDVAMMRQLGLNIIPGRP